MKKIKRLLTDEELAARRAERSDSDFQKAVSEANGTLIIARLDLGRAQEKEEGVFRAYLLP